MQAVVPYRQSRPRDRGALGGMLEQDRVRIVDVSVYTISTRKYCQLLEASALAANRHVIHVTRGPCGDAGSHELIVGPERSVEQEDVRFGEPAGEGRREIRATRHERTHASAR